MLKKLTTAIAVTTLLSASVSGAVAEEFLPISFQDGDNGGALGVAQSVYGKSQSMQTAIIDLDGDNSPEIAVKFSDFCDGDLCTTSFLYNSNGSWLEVLQAPVSKLKVGPLEEGALREISTREGQKWNWRGSKYYPVADTAKWAFLDGEQSYSLSDAEKKDSSIQSLFEIERYLMDVTGDGVADSIIISRDIRDCGGLNNCPAFVFDGGQKKVGEFFAVEGLIGINSSGLVVNNSNGYRAYRFSNGYFSKTEDHKSYSVRSN